MITDFTYETEFRESTYVLELDAGHSGWKEVDALHYDICTHSVKEPSSAYYVVAKTPFAVINETKNFDLIGWIFTPLKNKWLDETRYFSDPAKTYSNKNYTDIIRLGFSVVPLLISDLRDNDIDWIDALIKIIGINPVNPQNIGDFEKMKKDWITWYSKNIGL